MTTVVPSAPSDGVAPSACYLDFTAADYLADFRHEFTSVHPDPSVLRFLGVRLLSLLADAPAPVLSSAVRALLSLPLGVHRAECLRVVHALLRSSPRAVLSWRDGDDGG
eukprot:CAMPEP_0194304712 /NCGR_PEP_ID=MMETSP0171-20130528/2371_1 /TAXON_ID=218684 /ORGANISM="Corethron pennatum, Strain L29A3" /LENGTH=108 /DNA_ID=CAMNT_0039056055 /DNA_START=470 /DNA_END=793 /DNA_ORIENTATION=+